MTNSRARMQSVSPWRSIRLRIAAAFLAAIVAVFAAQAVLAWEVARTQDAIGLVRGYQPLARRVAQLERDHQRLDRGLRNLDRPSRRTRQWVFTEEMADGLVDARLLITHLSNESNDAEEQAFLARLGTWVDELDDYFQEYRQLFEAQQDADTLDAATLVRLRDVGNALGERVTLIDNALSRRMRDSLGETDRRIDRTRGLAWVLAGLAGAVSSVLLVAVLFALTPLSQLTREVQRLAAGEVGRGVEVRSSDEVGLLATEFNAMVAALQSRDRSLKERADQLDRVRRYLASVLDSLEDPLFVLEQGSVTLRNPAAFSSWGIDEQGDVPAMLQPLLRGPGRHDLQMDDGRHVTVHVAGFGAEGLVVLLSDVTDRVAARERLARSERLAMIGQMLAQITHEVRNPLNALSLNAELLGDELAQLDPARATESWDLLAMISGEIERLTDVTHHYLQLARRPPAQLDACNVREMIDEVTRLLEPELKASDVCLTIELDEVAPQLMDGNQIRQGLLNILRNAMEAGARSLHLSTAVVGHELQLCLDDDGEGMSPEQRERAVDPFFSTKVSGTGLGLAITRQILEDHGGRIAMAERPEGGTRITLILPRRDVHHEGVAGEVMPPVGPET